jgi:Spy/CpxP family protein refolding chaperone
MNPDALRKARLWLALVFLVGAVIGAVYGYSFGYRSYAATLTSQQQPMSEAERRAKCLADVTKEVDLTPEQTAKMDDIIKNANSSIKSIREKSDPDVEVVREQARNEMRALLTDAQKPKFEAMVQRMDAERKKRQQQMGK